jgi:hypothetical protein
MPKRPDLPDLASTGRRYRDDTLRVRLQSPGIERYVSKGKGPGRAARVLLAALVAAGLVAAMAWFARG